MTSTTTISNASEAGPAPKVTEITPRRRFIGIEFGELWDQRDLLGFLVARDVKIKYKQTLFGLAWAILVPLLQMIVFTVLFGRVAGLPSDGLPAPIFYYTALLPWTYFATALNTSSMSLVASANMLTKIYFPRLMIPLVPCLGGLIDFAVALVILFAMMAFYGIMPPASALLLPLLVAIAFTTALGTGLILATMNVKYRDVRYAVPFIVQLWMYGTVIVPFSAVAESLGSWKYVYALNPMVGVIEGFRWLLLRKAMQVTQIIDGQAVEQAVAAPWLAIAMGVPTCLLLLAIGIVYFRRSEETFADIV